MTLHETLLVLTRAFYLVVTVSSLYAYWQVKTTLYLNRVLLFSSLGMSIIFSWLANQYPQTTAWRTLSSMSLVAHPYFLLQLIQIFRPLSVSIKRLAFVGMLISELSIAIWGSNLPLSLILFIVVYFVCIEFYGAWVFIRGAFTKQGLARWRLGFASLGSGALGLIILLAGLVATLPNLPNNLQSIFEFLAFTSGVGFYLSFATPKWLRHAIQYSQLHKFLRAYTELKPEYRHSETFRLLCQSTLDAVGGEGAFIIEHDARNKAFQLRQTGSFSQASLQEPANQFGKSIEKAFAHHQPHVSRQPATWGTTEKLIADQLQADTIYYIPITMSERVWGILLIFLRGIPISTKDDLDLLMLYAEQAAIKLDTTELLERKSDLVEQLREYSTELKQTLEDERRQFFNRTPFLMAAIDFNYQFILNNPAWEHKLGYSHDELMSIQLEQLIHPDNLAETQRQLAQLTNGAEEVSFSNQCICSDGSIRWFAWNCTRSAAHQAIYIVMQDITEQKLAEEESARLHAELLSERERINNIIATIPGVVWEASGKPGTADQSITFVSKYAEEMLGYTVEEWLNTPNFWLKTVHPDDIQHAIEVAQETFSSGSGGLNEFRWVTKDGQVIWVASHSTIIKDTTGAPVGMRGVTVDISEHKRMQQMRSTLAAIVESSEDAIIGKTLDGTITSWNSGAERIYGYSREEMIGRSIHTLLPPDHKANLDTIYDQIRAGQSFSYVELPNICKDGRRILVSKSISPIRDINGDVVGASSIARDITRQKQAEDELKVFTELLAQSNKELENFAYIASHDLQEPLRKVEAFGSRLILKYGDKLDDQGVDYLNRMQKATRRMSRLIQDLLSYSRLTSLAMPFQMIDLNEVVQDVLSDLEFQIEESNAEIHVETLATIEADQVQINQLLQNLVSNSLKYRKSDTSPKIRIYGKIVENEGTVPHYALSIEDNGIGFDEEYADRIFDLFQRLHGRSEYDGTGMGLAICRKIVERHGGTINAYGQVNKGAVFTINVPIYQAETNVVALQNAI